MDSNELKQFKVSWWCGVHHLTGRVKWMMLEFMLFDDAKAMFHALPITPKRVFDMSLEMSEQMKFWKENPELYVE